MSLQFIVAVALLEGAALLEQFSEAKIADPRVLDLARRVEVVVDPEIDQMVSGALRQQGGGGPEGRAAIRNADRFSQGFRRTAHGIPGGGGKIPKPGRVMPSLAEQAERIIEAVERTGGAG